MGVNLHVMNFGGILAAVPTLSTQYMAAWLWEIICWGISYLFSIFYRFGLIEVEEKVKGKNERENV